MDIQNSYIGQDIRFEVLDRNRPAVWEREKSLCILFAVTGNVKIYASYGSFTLRENDLYVLNPYELHQIQVFEQGILLKMHLNVAMLRYHRNLLFGKKIFCCLRDETDDEDCEYYGYLRICMAKIFMTARENREDKCCDIYVWALRILETLYKNYSCTTEYGQDEEDTERMQRIAEYVEVHYRDTITLEDISSSEGLSPEFFSRYMRKKFGVSFTMFLRKTRLAHAYSQLAETRDSVTDIAMENGFANVNSYIMAFREEYGCTPGEYRKNLAHKKEENTENADKNETAIIEQKMKALLQEENESAKQVGKHLLKRRYHINAEAFKMPYSDTWREIIDGGYAKDLLMPALQKQIEKCQKMTGFRYICIRGILDEHMEFQRGFDYMDMLLDFAGSLQLIPYFVLRAEPGKESALENKLDRLLEYCEDHYGQEKMQGWRISVEGMMEYEPENNIFSFLQCYYSVWRMIKERVDGIRTGGPCGGIENQEQKNSWDIFCQFCEEKDCFPDFITFALKPSNDSLGILDEHCWRGRKRPEFIAERYESGYPIGDPQNDGAYNASHFLETVIKYGSRIQGICYCPTSDYSETETAVKEMFFGGRGILNYDGIPKCAFHVWEYLKYMEGRIISQGEEYILTEKKGQYRLLLSYPCETGKSERVSTECEITFSIDRIKPGEYEIECYSAGEEAGSAYDAWLYLGQPERTVKHARAQAVVERISDSLYTLNYRNTENGRLELTAHMKPNDIMILLFRRV